MKSMKTSNTVRTVLQQLDGKTLTSEKLELIITDIADKIQNSREFKDYVSEVVLEKLNDAL